jgi:HPt (histidine-containing phosphotransfer) domain-containing protein
MGVTTPIIAITANIMPEDREKYLHAGMSDCLNKPFKQRDLWACLMKYLAVGSPKKPIDMELGIENSAGDEILYRRVLQKFYDKQREVYDKIETAVREKDYSGAHMLAHKEGSVAAVIGAAKLSEILRDLEKALKDSREDGLDELMDSYGNELDEVIGYINIIGR